MIQKARSIYIYCSTFPENWMRRHAEFYCQKRQMRNL